MAEVSNLPGHMTVVNGVRVHRDDEAQFRARHKAVLAPAAAVEGAVEASARKAAAKRPAAKSAIRSDGA